MPKTCFPLLRISNDRLHFPPLALYSKSTESTPIPQAQPRLTHAHKHTLKSDINNFTFTEPEIPTPMSELTETVVCALGLAVGLVGIIVGTIFIFQGLRSHGAPRQPEPL